MTIFKAVVVSDDNDLKGIEVAIRDGEIAICPRCQQNGVRTNEITEFGLTFAEHHYKRLYVRLEPLPCPLSGEVLKIIGSNEEAEPEAILH